MNTIPIYVTTCNKNLWLIRGFAHLFNIYWGQNWPVTVLGFSPPDFELPENFTFYSIHPEEAPADNWSDALRMALTVYTDNLFVLLLEDYWLQRTVDTAGVLALASYMNDNPDVLRGDLTGDRLYAGGKYDLCGWGHLDLLETPNNTPYQISLQAGIWRRGLMTDPRILTPGKSPWEFEMHTGTPDKGFRVIGTYQMPVKYANILKNGKVQDAEIDKIPIPHRGTVRQWIR
jgi:hypothetical protein